MEVVVARRVEERHGLFPVLLVRDREVRAALVGVGGEIEDADVVVGLHTALRRLVRGAVRLPRRAHDPDRAGRDVDVVARVDRDDVPDDALLPVVRRQVEDHADEPARGLRRAVEVVRVQHDDGVLRRVGGVRQERREAERRRAARDEPVPPAVLAARARELDARAEEVRGTEAVAPRDVDDVPPRFRARERGRIRAAIAVDHHVVAADLAAATRARADLPGRDLHARHARHADRLAHLAIAVGLDAERPERHADDLLAGRGRRREHDRGEERGELAVSRHSGPILRRASGVISRVVPLPPARDVRGTASRLARQ
jgi:hypothetical protein